jgi:hypothetical protein
MMITAIKRAIAPDSDVSCDQGTQPWPVLDRVTFALARGTPFGPPTTVPDTDDRDIADNLVGNAALAAMHAKRCIMTLMGSMAVLCGDGS